MFFCLKRWFVYSLYHSKICTRNFKSLRGLRYNITDVIHLVRVSVQCTNCWRDETWTEKYLITFEKVNKEDDRITKHLTLWPALTQSPLPEDEKHHCLGVSEHGWMYEEKVKVVPKHGKSWKEKAHVVGKHFRGNRRRQSRGRPIPSEAMECWMGGHESEPWVLATCLSGSE